MVIAIGNADVAAPEGPVLAIPLPSRSPSIRVISAVADVGTFGVRTNVVATLAAKGMRGKKTVLELSNGSTVVGRTEHSWTRDDEVLEVPDTVLAGDTRLLRRPAVGEEWGTGPE